MFFTFSQSVFDFLNNQNKQIISNSLKEKIISSFNFDYYVEANVNNDFVNLEWNIFLKILKTNFNVQKVVVGQYFNFGKNKKGNINKLIAFFGVENVFVINYKKNSPSSTKIRILLTTGKIQDANNLLYKPFAIKGIIKQGKQIGRKINFPTANIYLPDKLLIPYGVYVTTAEINHKIYNSLTCYINQNNQDIVETYLIDQQINLYNHEIVVNFLKFLRNNVNINSLEHLRSLIQKDLKDTLAFFTNKN